MKVEKSNEIIYLSNIVSIYNKISVCNNTTQSTITKRLNKIYKIFDERFYRTLNNEEKDFFNKNVKILIDGKKKLNYKTACFFIPILLTYDHEFIKNLEKNKYTNYGVMIDWLYEVVLYYESFGIEIQKQNYIIKEKMRMYKSIGNNKRHSELEKTKLILNLKNEKDKELELFLEEIQLSFNFSVDIYLKLDNINKNIPDEKIFDLFNQIFSLPKTSKMNIAYKIDKIIKKEIKDVENRYKQGMGKNIELIDMDTKLDFIECKSLKTQKLDIYNNLEDETEYRFLKQLELNNK
ncbi:hypothetical protein [Paraclostridium sordellii]|uniref:hypothetical protein n=1 Tax=Paraclostridium sordellii TaxID=1505 RepID=UPI0005E77EB9|nr:hypothetical protein [Paeniclostridium sordellii]CEQ28802.1 Uncharacterised protein [[Clostridium] sordellii] [Paeniclostridium sordellii]